MATTTPNFGWSVPTSTDLVKDGATAIETLGDSIDASLVDLKGGTSGQILAKNSNTDMDFVWIANDQGDITAVNVTSPITGGGSAGAVTVGIDDGTTAQKGAVQLEDSTSSTSTTKAATPNSVKSAYDLANAAIPKSLVDAAGDLIYATADNTPARLGIGTASQVLAVNSGATAPEWVTPAAGGGMTLISSQTMASVSSVTFSSIPGTYTNLHLIIRGYYSSSGTPLMQWELNSDTTTGNYIGVADINRLVTSSNQEQWNTKAIVGSGMTYRTTSTSYNIISMTIPDYTNTVSWKYSFTEAIQLTDFSATDRAFMYGINSWQNNSAITNIKILNSSANNWTAGTALLYGVK